MSSKWPHFKGLKPHKKKSKNELSIDQKNYFLKILRQFDKNNFKPINLSLAAGHDLDRLFSKNGKLLENIS